MKAITNKVLISAAGLASAFTLMCLTAPAAQAQTTTLTLYSTGQQTAYSASSQTQFSSGIADTPWVVVSTPSGPIRGHGPGYDAKYCLAQRYNHFAMDQQHSQ